MSNTILDEVFMYDESEDSPRTLEYDGDFFYATTKEGDVRKFKLSKPYSEFSEEEINEVLDYNYGNNPDRPSKPYIDDIFVHGKFLTEIK